MPPPPSPGSSVAYCLMTFLLFIAFTKSFGSTCECALLEFLYQKENEIDKETPKDQKRVADNPEDVCEMTKATICQQRKPEPKNNEQELTKDSMTQNNQQQTTTQNYNTGGLTRVGSYFNYITNEGRTYPTSNPYYVPGTGNKAGTGYGGGGGPSNVIPDPSGRTDKNGQPIYVIAP